jgi:broad specificity phosphatase PhoE
VRLVYETHSTTRDNEAGIATGWLPGELSASGVENARALGDRRRDDGLDLVISSDLHRAVQTVEIAFEGSPVPRRTDPRLREVDYGELTGAAVEVIHGQRQDRVDDPFPGGQSYRDVSDGVRDLLAELGTGDDGQRVLLVGHAATRFALDHLLTGRPLEAAVAAPFAWREGWEYVLGDHPPEVEVLDGPSALAAQDALVEVYRGAFTAPGYDEGDDAVARFADEQLPAHAARDGFRLVTVRDGSTPLGFAYGYTGEHGQWWTDQMTTVVPADLAATWLGGHFEVVELAVLPEAQGRGFGAALVESLLHGLPHRRALLTTYADDRPAPRLYRRLGWQHLAAGVFDGSDLWGLELTS